MQLVVDLNENDSCHERLSAVDHSPLQVFITVQLLKASIHLDAVYYEES